MTPEIPTLALSFSDLALSDFYDYYLMPSATIICDILNHSQKNFVIEIKPISWFCPDPIFFKNGYPILIRKIASILQDIQSWSCPCSLLVESRSWKLWKGRSWTRNFWFRRRNPGLRTGISCRFISAQPVLKMPKTSQRIFARLFALEMSTTFHTVWFWKISPCDIWKF